MAVMGHRSPRALRQFTSRRCKALIEKQAIEKAPGRERWQSLVTGATFDRVAEVRFGSKAERLVASIFRPDYSQQQTSLMRSGTSDLCQAQTICRFLRALDRRARDLCRRA